MPTTQERFKLSALSFAILTSVSMQAYAAEDDSTEKEQKEEVEVIEVQGFRGSLAKSINDKRFAKNIADTINAEDIGKNTDQNIADALGRVTGVSIVSRDGEGSQITVRGASASQNTISLNGQQLTSTDFNQSVDLSSFSADILSRLEVKKALSADDDEGSLGASVNLVSIKPLNVQKEQISGTVQGRYNDFAEEADYKIQVSGTKKFLDETLGVALTVYDETNTYRKDQYRTGRWENTRTLRVAKDQDGNIINNVRAMSPNSISYGLNNNTSDRYGASLGVQWLPTDATELMLNLTYSNQTKTNSLHGYQIRFPGNENFIEGVVPLTDTESLPAPFTDPQEDWYTIDTDTHTLTKRLDRFAAGDITRSIGGSEADNLALSLEVKHDLSDDFIVSGQVGYSSSKSESLPGLYANLQNFLQVPNLLLEQAGDQIQEIGYDCSSGLCQIQTGTAFIDVGENVTNYDDGEGNTLPGWRDNTNVLTGFNPADNNAFSLGNFTENDTTVEDTLANAQIDFDYYVDLGPITMFEFGAKVTSREKFVDDQQYSFNSVTKSDPIVNDDNVIIAKPSGPLNQIRAIDILDENGLGYDNFMHSLGIAPSLGTQNLTTIDVNKAFNLVTDHDELVRTVNNIETRKFELDTSAFYLKANFELLDGRITGDLGVRYVETEVAASGYSGGKFHDFDQHADESEFDWLTLRDLRDTSLPACPQPTYADPDDPKQYEQKFWRIDGTGWDTSAGPDPTTWTRAPMYDPNGDGVQDACHDPNYAAWAQAQRDGVAFEARPGFSNPNWQNMWRYADIQVTADAGWDASLTNPNVEWNGNTNGDWANYTVLNTEDRSVVTFPTSDSHTYSNVLPSLNLNFMITDELLARFAVSRTMTRPEYEQTRAGFQFNQMWATYWGGGHRDNIGRGSVDLNNTKLEPLTSDNLDLSIEWYFNATGMLSAAYFSKDMKNFVDTETTLSYIADLRNVEGTFDVSNLLLEENGDASSNYGLNGCSPVRTTTDLGFLNNDPLVISEDYRDLCLLHNVNKTFNGDSAKIEGVELGYSQTYDFLPGLLGGLGLSANYTYQNSEYARQESTLIPGKLLPSYPVADTPKHSYNATMFWEQDGHQVRLSYRGSSDSLVGTDWDNGANSRGRTWFQGSIWNEGRDTFDLSMTYKINDQMDLTFQAINLTDEAYRMYYTNRELPVERVANEAGNGYDYIALEEGNPLEGEAPTSRTYNLYKVGTTYRLGLRARF
ncbi:TonB-dependent receptor [Catenovulum sediminis]|uniref:TonB-dependent receptor n=1 Tax=Catenovulum sediminis TaxID=1740262 RepID=A0ABV1RIK2_9ALTE